MNVARMLVALGALVPMSLVGPGRPAHAAAAGPTVSAPPARIVVTADRMTAEVAGVGLRWVLDTIARRTGIRIVLHTDGDEPVTVRFQSLPFDQGLRRILPAKSLVLIYAPASGGGRPTTGRLAELHVYAGPGEGGVTMRSVGTEQATARRAPGNRAPAADALGEHNHRRTRRQGIEALGRRWDADVVDSLARALALDDDLPVRESAAEALGNTWSESAVEPLASALLRDPESSVREAAARALGETWSAAAVDPLGTALLGDPRRGVRESAAHALGEIGTSDAMAILVAALGDADPSVREGVVRALGAIGSPEAAAALVETSLRDRDSWVRERAAAAVSRLTRAF